MLSLTIQLQKQQRKLLHQNSTPVHQDIALVYIEASQNISAFSIGQKKHLFLFQYKKYKIKIWLQDIGAYV